MSTTSTIRILRDLALTVGGVAITALVAQEADWSRGRAAARAAMPATPHGWLLTADSQADGYPRRLRLATAVEAAASTASRAVGNNGWIAVTGTGQVLPVDDPAVIERAGRFHGAEQRIDIVYVADSAGRPVTPVVIPLAGDGQDDEDDWTDDVSAYDAEGPADHADASSS